MSSKTQIKAMVVSFFILVASFLNFIRLTGSASISGSQIIMLLICGIAIGVFVTSLFSVLRDWRP